MTLEQIRQRIMDAFPTTFVDVIDLGGGDHIRAIVVSPEFRGKSLIAQHKMILELFRAEIDSNEVHALTVKTMSPEQYESLGG